MMSSNKVQLLKDPDVQPSLDVITKALEQSQKTYTRFLHELINHGIGLEWRYYNDGKAWLAKGLIKWTGVRGSQKEKTIFWLSIWEGAFKVTMYMPEEARLDCLSLSLSNQAKELIAVSKPMGKFRFFPIVFEISSDERFVDLFLLIDFIIHRSRY